MGKINKPYGEIGFQKEGYEKGGTAIVGTQPHEKRSNVDDIENAGNPQASEVDLKDLESRVETLENAQPTNPDGIVCDSLDFKTDSGDFGAKAKAKIGAYVGTNFITLPTYPATTEDKTYVLKLVNGTLTWVEEE